MKKYLLILLICSQSILAQMQFEAKVSKTTLGINENLRVDFSMNFDGDNFVPPNFQADGFRVVGGPSQQVSQTWVNGRGTFNKAYSYYLLPLQKGVLTLKSATIEYNGQVFKSNPVKITVTNAVQRPRDPSEQPQLSADTELHLVADVSKTNPYINEPITVVYKLYFSNNIGITNFLEANKPKYNDFWSQNIEIKELQLEQAKFKGEDYRYVVLKKVVLYPQKSGKLEIEPLAIDVDVQLPTNRRNIFGQIMVVEDQKRVSAGNKVINVKPLPEAGKPIDFTGAVGQFAFKVTPSKTSLKSGESLNLNVSVSGKGNLKLFSLPKPVVPTALEMYDPEHTENITTPLSGMTGSITDKYVIVPQFKGKYPVKPMTFSYFDPSSGTYKTLTSPEIMVDVLEGPEYVSTTPVVGIGKANKVKNLKMIDNLTKTQWISTKRNDFLGSTKCYLFLLLPLLMIPIIIFLKKKKEALDSDIVGNRIRMNQKLAKKYLSQAKKQLQNKAAFYIALEKAMHNFLKAKLHLETTEMSKENIEALLLGKSANPETVTAFLDLTENCEIARYAPSSAASIQQDYDRAVMIISDLEKQLSQSTKQ
ncbi:BatD family protein [Flavobacterium branchiophilum]|uniref:BatD protein n=1 Tax=Flavobacterium branchiophilum TaxID=55197 RepID=A0A2H3KGM0_9FLAO|nr:BatD family protein [Flavobacterium branchiophilum]PDS22824.1 BatD protein [Flavobacterium branchiophilum]